MPSIADAVARIQAAGLPVLFADTCSLLDVIRAPLRPAELAGCVEAASDLLHLVITPPVRCTLVVASFVSSEWSSHAGPESDNLRAHLTRIDEEADRLHGFCGLVGIAPPFSKPEYRMLTLADRLHDLSRRLLDSALRLDQDNDCNNRAYRRAVTYTPPSRKGGEVKDSTIIEECLEVSRRLQAAGFAGKRVFCTSNKKDFCEAGSRLHPALAVDFGAAGLGFATNLRWAVNEIQKP
jgi:hypothetical protein